MYAGKEAKMGEWIETPQKYFRPIVAKQLFQFEINEVIEVETVEPISNEKLGNGLTFHNRRPVQYSVEPGLYLS